MTSGVLLVACQPAAPVELSGDTPAPVVAPIINGDVEAGWPAVGALTSEDRGLYLGPFCTATLIAPRWVLTAAHCIPADVSRPGPAISFYLGDDARPRDGARPPGRFVRADALVPHPDYEPMLNHNDVALVHLTEVVTDVAPQPINHTDLEAWFAERGGASPPEIFVVGFGATEGVDRKGSGIKRSTTVTLDRVLATVYTTAFVDTGVCYGDSGGPSFLALDDGAPRIIGITAALTGLCAPSDATCDPCASTSFYTRVDVFADWITRTVEGPAPDCRELTTMCACPEACSATGACDPSVVCRTGSCTDAYGCVRRCAGDATCEATCLASATDEAVPEVDALRACSDARCTGLSGQDQLTCENERCRSEYATCHDIGLGEAACADVYGCAGACRDLACLYACLSTGSADAQTGYHELLSCLYGHCTEYGGGEGYAPCARLACRDALDACFPPTHGSLDCGAVDRCTRLCPEGDAACSRQCYDQGTAQARTMYDELWLCTVDECSQAEDADGCRASRCAAEVAACDPPPPRAEGESCAAGERCAEGLTCERDLCTAPCVDGCGPTIEKATDDGCAGGAPDLGPVMLVLGALGACRAALRARRRCRAGSRSHRRRRRRRSGWSAHTAGPRATPA